MSLRPDWTRADRRTSAVPLALFRILFGLCLALDVLGLLRYEAYWFDETPWLTEGPAWVTPALWIWFVAAVGLCLGAFTRVSAIVNYVGCVTFLSFNAMPLSYEYHPDNLYLVTSFVLPFLPLGRTWSIDAWRTRGGARSVGPASEIFLALVVSSIYLDSAVWKLSSSMWVSGLGYWAPATQHWFGCPSFEFTLENRWLALASGYVVLVYELLFVVLVWFRRLRLPLLAVGFVLHVGIGTFLPIPLFGLIMCAFLFALVPLRPYERDTDARAPRPLVRRAIAGYYTAWGCAFAFGLISPVRALVIDGFGGLRVDSERFWYHRGETAAQKLAARAAFWTYRVVGWRSHPIFVDSQFELASFETRLRYHQGPADVSKGGEGDAFYPPHYNRRFKGWYYRSVWPRIRLDHVEARLARFVQFHAGRGDIDLSNGFLTVETRAMEIPVDGWRAGQRARNLDQPWERIGTIDGSPEELRIEWTDAPWGTAGRIGRSTRVADRFVALSPAARTLTGCSIVSASPSPRSPASAV